MASLCNDSDEIFDHQCSVCRTKNKNVEAEKYCVDCPDYYCNKCVKDVHSVPALKKHKIIGRDVAGSSSPSMPTSRCGKHGHQIMNMYCKNHDQVGCYTCIILDHRNCDNADISEYVRTNNTVVPDFLQAVRNVESELKVLLDTFNTDQKRLHQNKQAVIDQINTIRTRLENRIRKAAEDTIQKLEKEYDQLNKDFKDQVICLGVEIDKLNTTYKEINSCLANLPQAFFLANTHKECVPDAKRVREKMERVSFDKRFALSLGTDYQTIIEKKESCLGNVIITPCMYSLSRIGSITPTENDELDDSCCTPDGSIFLIDWDTNSLIRVCSENMKIIEHHKLPSEPRGVCCISDNEIAVCLITRIDIFNINDGLKLLRTFDIKIDGNGISYLDDALYVASFTGVYKYNMDGTLLESFHKDTDGNCIFSRIWAIAVNPMSKYIHIADINKGVITMDQNGSVVNIVKDNISCPCGISVDKYGQVFVSGVFSNNIIQLNCDGKYVRTVITDGLSRPKALCIDNLMGRLYIANNNGKNIDVYKMTE